MAAVNFDMREFDEKDLSSLCGLIRDTIDVSYHGVYPPQAIDFFKEYHSEENILNDAAAGYTLVAECGGQIVGTGTLLGTNVCRVFTSPQHQRQGIGKAIAQKLEKKAQRSQSTAIELDASLVSRRFWESLGFTVSGEYFVPVGDGQKLYYYQMVKYLQVADNL
jgi:GNAT superfamily N-acetyltransferase